MPRPLFTPGKDLVPIIQEAGWAPGPVWRGAENLAPTGIRSPDCPARSQSLYRLRYLAHSPRVVIGNWLVKNYTLTMRESQKVRFPILLPPNNLT